MFLSSKILLIFVLLCVAHRIHGHTYLSAVYLDDQLLSEGDCVRPHPQFEKEYPILSVLDDHNTCGWLPAAANPANRKCPIRAGSPMGVQWHHNHNGPADDILELTHKGPVSVYLASSSTGKGAVWFKIYEDGYDNNKQEWATDRLVRNRGRLDFIIPADLKAGNYLLRVEVLALHNAYDVNGIQPYVGCVELSISGTGTATPSGVPFPGTYTPEGTGMLFNIYQPYTQYTIPGPAVYRPTNTPTNPPTNTPTNAPTNIPTNKPTSTPKPTQQPTSAPTVRPTTSPTRSPTTSPTRSPTTSPTTRPTASPTYSATTSPSPSSPPVDTVKIQLNGGSNQYWCGVQVSGGGGVVVKVEIRDSKSGADWRSLSDKGYAYVYEEYQELMLPLSVRVTSSTGKQVLFSSAIQQWTPILIDSGRSF